jgi:hypothetical protein
MKSLEVVAAIVILAGLVIVLTHPQEASAFVGRVLNSVRWIHNDVPSHM